MEPVQLLRVVKRQWRIVAVLTILGGLLGYASTLLESDEGPAESHYLATHILTVSGGGGGRGGDVTLQRAAFSATRGEVPARVAEAMGVEAATLIRLVAANPRPDLGTLEITVTGTDPNFVVDAADRLAGELITFIEEQATATYETEEASLVAQIDQVRGEYGVKNDECNALPPEERGFCQIDLADIEKEYQQLDAQLDSLQASARQQAVFQTLETATAIPLSGPEFQASLNANAQALQGNGDDRNRNRDDERSTQQQRIDDAVDDSASPVVRTLLGALAGLVLGIAGVLAFDRLDPRLHTKDQAEAAFGLPVLAEVPVLTRAQQRHRDVLASLAPRSRAAEAYRTVRSALEFLDTGARGAANGNGNGHGGGTAPAADTDAATAGPAGSGGGGTGDAGSADAGSGDTPTETPSRNGRVLLVTSPGPAEGKTTSVANLAAVLAETGDSVLVINCDFRRPRLHEYLGGENVARRVVETQVPGVRMVNNVFANTRDANPAEVIAEQRRLAEAARKHFDIVLLDTAPVLSTNDAADVLPVADQVLVVARAGKTTGEAADRAAELLERLGAPVAGVVLVGARSTPASRYYYYYEPGGDRPARAADEAAHPLEHLLDGASRER